ncbi:MAG: MerR family transcriptional regulator, partial [Clostridium perfringens]|nr:MerR family transcriptional regulator [Clostridium perfringens]
MYTVKEVAKILNLTEHTIRYYANNGLIPTLKRDKNNIRLFDEDSVNWISFVRHLKNCGMSIKEVKEFVDLWVQGNSTVPIRYEIILEQKEKTKEELTEVQNRLD